MQRIWLDPKRLAKGAISLRPRKAFWRVHGRPHALAGLPPVRTCLLARASKPYYLWSHVARILAAAALSAGSHGAFEPPQEIALLVIARDKDMEDEHAANRLQHRCEERGIPSIVIVPHRSDLNDDLIAFGEETLAARIEPFIASIRSAATVEERRGIGRIITPS